MAGKEGLLETLIRSELEDIKDRLKYWLPDFSMQEGRDWVTRDSLTLEKFLTMNPCPKSDSEIALYGIAWEFIWGEKPPEVVTQARENVIRKANLGMKLDPNEELWIKLIHVDTDMF